MKAKFVNNSLFIKVLICVPIFIYFINVLRASINFPLMDDYDAILGFLISNSDSTNLFDKIELLFSQHNEHRIVYTKLVVLGYHKLFGAINFIPLIVIGNLSLVGILLVFYKSVKIESTDKKLLFFVPVSLFLFNYRYAELSCWAMTSIQNIGVLLFAFISLYFLLKENNPSVFWAAVFATIATYTSGNGILTFITGVIVLVLKKEPLKSIIIFSLAFLLNLSIYFIGLNKVEGHPPFLQSFIEHPLDFFLYPLNFIGSLFYGHSTVIGYIYGALILVLFAYIFFKKFYKNNYVLFAFILFMLATVGIVTVSRFGFGLSQACSSRYAVNSTLIYIIIGLIFYEIHYLKLNYKYYILLLSIVLLFNWFSFDSIKGVSKTASLDREKISQIFKGESDEYNIYYPEQSHTIAKTLLKNANNRGIFAINTIGLEQHIKKIENNFKTDTSNVEYGIDEEKWLNDSTYKISGWILVKNIPSYKSKIWVGLENDTSHIYIERPQTIYRKDITKRFKKHNCNYDLCGFSRVINLSKYQKGEYQLSILISVDSLNLKEPLNIIIKK